MPWYFRRLRVLGLIWAFFERVGGVSRSGSVRIYGARTLLQIVAMWGTFLVIGPLLILGIERMLGLDRWHFAFAGQRLCGALLFLACASLGLSCAFLFITRGDGTPLPSEAPRKFVVAGAYRYVRNPMAIGGLGQGAAVGLACGSPLVLVYAFLGALVWNYVARPWEENDLQRRFGAEYENYRAAVRCWWPRCKPYEAIFRGSL